MASTHLTRTFSSGDTQKFTISFWMKKSNTADSMELFGRNTALNDSGYNFLRFDDNDKLTFGIYNTNYRVTNRQYRDVNAWYHIVLAVDTTLATGDDRVIMYTNGVRETSFSADTDPAQNFNFPINAAVEHKIGLGNTEYFSGCLAHFHFIDGTQYAASDFGQTDTASGIWKPKLSPSVTYGTNGFFLKFANSGSLGTDSSGNANNFTVNGTGTQTLDTPSNVFATWNPLDKGGGSYTFANGNTRLYTNGGVNSTLAMGQGKWYAEFKMASDGYVTAQVGVGNQDNPISSAYSGGNSVSLYVGGATLYVDGSSSGSYGSAWTYNDIMQIAVDLDNHNIYFGKNGSWWSGSAFDSSTPSTAVSISSSRDNYVFRYVHGGNVDSSVEANFGNGYFGTTAVASANSDSAGIGKFEYSVPSGYYALCTKNIADYG